MSNRYTSLVLSLASIATATIVPSLPVHAAACETGDLFDFDSINFIDTRPISSDNCLRFFGERVGQNDPDPQGFVAYGAGHEETSLNAPEIGVAPYYAAGIDFSPENLPGARRAATLLDDITGFSNFNNFLSDNDISVDRIGFSFGPRDGIFTNTWNLGADINGQNYFSSPTSTLEERIYSANPDDVEIFLLLDDTEVVNFGYSDIYSFLEYGGSTAPNDDSEAIISDPFRASKAEGISGLSDGLADAFLADVGNDKIQLVSEDTGVVPDFFSVSDPFGPFDPIVSIRFPAQLRVVNVPEPSIMVSLLGLSVLAVSSRSNKKNRSHH